MQLGTRRIIFILGAVSDAKNILASCKCTQNKYYSPLTIDGGMERWMGGEKRERWQ